MQSTAQPHTPVVSPRAIALAAGIERAIVWVGSSASLVLHTIVFIVFFAVSIMGLVGWNLMLLILTTVVSLEAIYLAIFIQFSVNRQSASLKGVEEDVETIQENVEELGEHVEGIHEDVEELGEHVEGLHENVEELGEHVEGIKEDVEDIQEDIGEDTAEELRKKKQAEMLESLTRDVKTLLSQLEALRME
jgi:uncharacterized protein YoxC